MNCQEINSQLGALLDQELGPAEAPMIRLHVARCVECQGELERLRALKTAMQNVESPAVSASLDERVLAAFQLQHSRASAISKTAGWRAWFYNSFVIPKPALALIGLLLVGTAMMAYKAGEITGTRSQVITPPAPVYSRSSAPRAIESVRVVHVKTPGGCPRQKSQPSAMLAQTRLAKPALAQFENQASASEAGIDYTTRAVIENAEPVKDASVRVIKGENR
ncbi:MAG TPA: zf-HC2 domain-containing protein [Blastocatellia bacterium]|nr:zf-HC2 domain-containing protein [Blastocatellia bacterium]